MRSISTPSVRSDGTARITVTDYHPARVFRGRQQEVVRHTYATSTEIEEESRQILGVVADAGRGNASAQVGVFSRLGSKRPLSTVRILYPLCLYCQYYLLFLSIVFQLAQRSFYVCDGGDQESISV